MQELFCHEGHLKPLALEAGEIIHPCRMPSGSGLLHGHCKEQNGERQGALRTNAYMPVDACYDAEEA